MTDRTLPANAPERLWTSKDVCQFLGVGKNAPADLVRRGELRAMMLGRRLRFTPADVRAYAERCVVGPPGQVLPWPRGRPHGLSKSK